ncbi:VOC family protein [Arthrobacter sp. JSM 101049]|uniref:VOC family protein n=1 Tax=Arthrobacter sp. JSM 101049 TaxID=929097 RepID=UPI003562F90B
MALRLSELILESTSPEELARFWCGALDLVILSREDDGSVEIGPESGFGGVQPTIVFSTCAEPSAHRGRLHLDVNPVASTRSDEVERLRGLGAREADIGQTGEEPWTVLQDPEGNVFCVLDTPLQ